MKRFLLFAIAMILLTVHCHAQGTKNVTDHARHEIERLGNHAEETGTVRSNQISQTLAHPADDSAKWFITLVIKGGDPACDAMRDIFAKDPALKAWVDVDTPANSFTHYQVRRIDDATQKDWLKPIKASIDEHGLPCIVVQPPLNGKFGKQTSIVKLIHGQMPASELSDKLREAMTVYAQTLAGDQPNAGNKVSQANPAGAVAPPFTMPTNNPGPNVPHAPSVPFEFPPAAPKELTIDQIKAACPGATPEFVLDAVESKVTSIEIVKLKWEVAQAKKACDRPQSGANSDPPEKEKPSTPFVAVDGSDKDEPKSEPVPGNFCLPACPTPSSTEMLVIVGLVGVLLGLVMMGLSILLAAKIGGVIPKRKTLTTETIKEGPRTLQDYLAAGWKITQIPDQLTQSPPSTTQMSDMVHRQAQPNFGLNGNGNAMPPVPSVTPIANNG